MTAAGDIPAGHVGNLTASQDEKLRQFWKILIEAWDGGVANSGSAEGATASSAASITSTSTTSKRFSFIGRTPTQLKEDQLPAVPPKLLVGLHNLKASANEISAIQSLLPKFSDKKLPAAYLSMLKQDHPDALLLRYLRAEKWDVPKAWIKLVGALNWRSNEYQVDEQVMRTGEAHALEASKSKDASVKKDGDGFLRLLKTGEGHVHGTDKDGRPILVIRVKLHDPNGQTSKAMNDFVIHLLESTRLTFTPPVETMTIVFDMVGFGISNWDLTPVKFIVDTFQTNYPECLGNVIFYNSPWVFSGLWRIVKGLLDPVVASKVHFLNGVEGLEQIIPRSHIIKELGGEEDWEFRYIEPQPNENDKLQDTAPRDSILAEREKLGQELFTVTLEWTQTPQDEAIKSRREESIQKLYRNYWDLDPYVRSRTILDRTGVIRADGQIDFYPAGPAGEAQTEAKPVEAETKDTDGEKIVKE